MKILKAIAVACFLAAASSVEALGQSLIRDTEIEHLLREYTDPILVAAGLQPADVDMYLVADPSMNAFVTGGQNIFLHTGIIVEASKLSMTSFILLRHLKKVDFPQPEGPIRDVTSYLGKSRATLLMAILFP